MPDDHLPLSNATHIAVNDRGIDRIVLISEICEQLKVDALIRLHVGEFNLISPDSHILVHFNLEFTLNEAGKHYAVVPIVRSGRRLLDGQEVLPIINLDASRRGICTQIIQHLSIDDVTTEQFSASLPNIRTPDDLRAALIRRYARMFPNHSEADLLNRGCALTYLIFTE